MVEKDIQYSRALQSAARLEQDAVERARATAAQARADASRPRQAAREQPAVVSVPALGPYVPPGMGGAQRHAEGQALLEAMQRQLGRQWATAEGPAGDDR